MRTLDGPVPVEVLRLDPDNPRLPEDVQGSEQPELLEYLYENDVLEELVESYSENGYFPNEPLLVLPPDEDDRRTVVEGNRRLAALMIVLELPPAREAGIQTDVEISPERLAELRAVPCAELESRDEVSTYLGFRHISGLKTWKPEAKARWLWRQVEAAAGDGSEAPFYEVGRRVGSNARGVRNAYHAYNLLKYGRDSMSLAAEAREVIRDRFSVWTRMLGTAHVAEYIGIGRTPRDYDSVRGLPEELDEDRLGEVLRDLLPSGPNERPTIRDSRQVTTYSEVLANDRARETLRQYGDLELAAQIVEQGRLGDRLGEIVNAVEVLTRDVRKYEGVGSHELAAAEELLRAAKGLAGAIGALSEPTNV